MSSAFGALNYAVRPRVLLKYLGQLSLIAAALTLAPFTAALIYSDYSTAWRYVAVATVLCVVGGGLARLRPPRRMQANEGIVLVAAAFLLLPLIMTYPLMGSGLGFTDALFEAISAATTTGLSTVSNIESMPPTMIFARAWMQWYGGLGIVAFSLALVVRPGFAAMSLAAETDGLERDDLVGGVRAHTRRIVIVYVLLTVAAIALLLGLGLSPLHAISYAFAAISTGGFAPHIDSLGALQSGSAIAVSTGRAQDSGRCCQPD